MPDHPSAPGPDDAQRSLDSRELFGDAQELVIVHKGAAYRLRITRQDKLILTK